MNDKPQIPSTLELLDTLIGFDTVSAKPNISLIQWIQSLLENAGVSAQIITNTDKTKANLFATIGPSKQGGFMLSGHTDVVPVEGQQWTVEPFAMSINNGKVYGRGSADMKGFVACALHAALCAASKELKTPLQLAFSYDEEIGCVGVHSMLDMLATSPVKPLMCLVGEPTQLQVAVGHKGKTACHVNCTGRAGHSALAPQALNAIHLATDLIVYIRQLQETLKESSVKDHDYDVPYTTLHVSNIRGGVALNVVPDHCQFDLEIRNIAEDDPHHLLQTLKAEAQRLTTLARHTASEALIDMHVFNAYPGLQTAVDDQVVGFVQSLVNDHNVTKVAFGTEGGLFSQQLRVPTVVCGPGSMQQGHKPDEFVALEQLDRCDSMLATLLTHLETGLTIN